MNLKESTLYEGILRDINGDKVKKWKFRFYKKEYIDKKEYIFDKEVKGIGNIQWDILEDTIKEINSRYRRLRRTLKGDFDIIHIDLENLFAYHSDKVLTAEIILENSDYVIVDEGYFSYDDEFRLDIQRFDIPKIGVEKETEITELIEYK